MTFHVRLCEVSLESMYKSLEYNLHVTLMAFMNLKKSQVHR